MSVPHPHLRHSMLLLGLALAVTLVMLVLVVSEAGTVIANERLQQRLSLVLPPLRAVLEDLQDAETGQRGYLLSQSPAYLEPYERARRDTDHHMQEVLDGFAGDPGLRPRLERIDALRRQKFDELAATVALARAGHVDEAVAQLRSDRGKQLMDELRPLLGTLISELTERRARVNRETQLAVRRAEYLFVGFCLLVGLGVMQATWLLRRAVHDNAALSARLAHEATHDALTGLPNRRLLHEWLPPLLAQARRRATAVALFYIDLDGFKLINDRLGHAAGDEVLRLVAERAGTVVRSADLLVRLGGDEFALVVLDADSRAGLELLAQRLLAAISAPLPAAMQGYGIGASIGVACFPAQGDDADAVLAQADDAMYAAKQAGKGCVRFAGEAPAGA